MPYTIAPVTESQLERAVDIWRIAFGAAERDRFRKFARESLSLFIGAFLDGELHATAGIIDFQIHLGKRWLPCGGIAAVATNPPHRRRQLVKKMLTECLRVLHERRVPLSTLWPFSYPFYRRMGWAVTDLQYSIEVDPSSLPDQGDPGGYKMISLDQFRALMPLHDRWVEQNNLSIRRDEQRWQRMLSDPECSWILYVHNDGYMLWNIKKPTDRLLAISEWACLSQSAFLDGLSLLRHMRDLQFDRVRWRCCDIEPFLALGVPDPKPTILVKPGMMSRVVHIDAFREALPVKTGKLVVRDPLGISGDAQAHNGLDPGGLVQLVTGFWREPPVGMPADLSAVAADFAAYSAEMY